MSEKKPSTKPVRLHAFMTYAEEKDFLEVIRLHHSSIRSFAYIYHGRDDSTPHTHLVIRTYDAWTPRQINKWFDKLKLEKNVNTFNEPGGDIGGLKAYVTHSDRESIESGKSPYDFSEVKDFGLFSEYTDKDSYDDTFEIINAMIAGVDTRTLVRRYGKKLIYHYNQFLAVKENIEREDYYRIERSRPEREQLPYGWRSNSSYDAPDFACSKPLSNAKPIPLDNQTIDDILN